MYVHPSSPRNPHRLVSPLALVSFILPRFKLYSAGPTARPPTSLNGRTIAVLPRTATACAVFKTVDI